jgi:spore maturation protein CgeB
MHVRVLAADLTTWTLAARLFVVRNKSLNVALHIYSQTSCILFNLAHDFLRDLNVIFRRGPNFFS